MYSLQEKSTIESTIAPKRKNLHKQNTSNMKNKGQQEGLK